MAIGQPGTLSGVGVIGGRKRGQGVFARGAVGGRLIEGDLSHCYIY